MGTAIPTVHAGNWIFGSWRQTVKSSANIAQNSFLVGDGTNNMIEKTPAEVLSLLGISYGDTLPTAGTAGRIFFKKMEIVEVIKWQH